MSASQIQAGKAYVAIYGDLSPIRQDLKKLAPELRKHGDELAKIGDATAATFSKGTKEIMNATEGTKAAAVQFNIAAIASNSFSKTANDALLSTAVSSRTTATATQRLVEQMNNARPASKGFATAFGSLKSMDITLANGAFGVSSIITLLKAGGPATKPLLDALTGIVGKAQQLKGIQAPVANIASAINAAGASGSQKSSSSPGGITKAELATMFAIDRKDVDRMLKNLGAIKTGKLGSANVYSASVVKQFETILAKSAKGGTLPTPAKGFWATFHEGFKAAAKGTTVGMNGGAIGALNATMDMKNGFRVLGSASRAGTDIAVGGLVGVSRTARLALQGINNLTQGLAGTKATFGPLFGKMTAAQKVATQAQNLARFAGNKEQKAAAKQMGVEADAAAVGEAFARGWVPGFAKYASVGIPRVIMGSLKGIGPMGAGGAAIGGTLGGPLGAVAGLLAVKLTPSILRSTISLAKMAAGSKTSAGGFGVMGSAAMSAVPRLERVKRTIDAVRMAAAGQGLSVAHGLGLGAFAVAATAALSGIAGLAGNHSDQAVSRVEAIGIAAAKARISVEAMSSIESAARSTGTSLSTVTSSFGHLGDVIAEANDGEEDAIKKLNRLGLSGAALKRMDIEGRMQRVGAALSAIRDPLERDRRAMEIFGDSGAALVPLLTNLDRYKIKLDAVSKSDITPKPAPTPKIPKIPVSPQLQKEGPDTLATAEMKSVVAARRARATALAAISKGEINTVLTASRAQEQAESASAKKQIAAIVAIKRARQDADPNAKRGPHVEPPPVTPKTAKTESPTVRPKPGSIISLSDVEAAREMNVAIARLKTAITNAWNQIGMASVRSTTQWVSGISKFLEKNEVVVQSLLKITAGLGAAAGGMVVWSKFGGPVVAVIKAIGMAVAALMSPIGLVAIAIGAGVAAWMYFTESGNAAANWLGERFAAFSTFFKEVWGGMVAAIAKGDMALAGNIAWTALKLGFLLALSEMGISWSETMKDIYEAAQVVTDGITNVWAALSTTLRSIMAALQGFYLKAFDNIGGAWADLCIDMMQALAPAHNAIGKQISFLFGKATGQSDADIAETMKSHDEETRGNAVQAAIDKRNNRKKFKPETLEAVDGLESNAAADNAKTETDRKAAIAGHANLLRERMAALKPDDARIKDMKAELAGMIDRAKAIESDPGKKPPVFNADAQQMGGGKESSVAGTFSAAAAAGMGGGGPMTQLVRSSAEMVKELKELKESLKQNRHAKDDAIAARNSAKSSKLRGERFGK